MLKSVRKLQISSQVDPAPAATVWLYNATVVTTDLSRITYCTSRKAPTSVHVLCLHAVTPLLNKFIATSKGWTGDRSQWGRPGVNPSKRL